MKNQQKNIYLTQNRYNLFETIIIKLSLAKDLKHKLIIYQGKHITPETGFPSYAVVELNKKPICALYNDKFILLNSSNFTQSEQAMIKLLTDTLTKFY